MFPFRLAKHDYSAAASRAAVGSGMRDGDGTGQQDRQHNPGHRILLLSRPRMALPYEFKFT